MEKLIKKVLEHIQDLYCSIERAENNLQYITRLKALKKALDKFDNLLLENKDMQSVFAGEYLQLFYTGCGWSQYDRVCNSIIDYEYGNKPF